MLIRGGRGLWVQPDKEGKGVPALPKGGNGVAIAELSRSCCKDQIWEEKWTCMRLPSSGLKEGSSRDADYGFPGEEKRCCLGKRLLKGENKKKAGENFQSGRGARKGLRNRRNNRRGEPLGGLRKSRASINPGPRLRPGPGCSAFGSWKIRCYMIQDLRNAGPQRPTNAPL